jgi:hypothetical protein
MHAPVVCVCFGRYSRVEEMGILKLLVKKKTSHLGGNIFLSIKK